MSSDGNFFSNMGNPFGKGGSLHADELTVDGAENEKQAKKLADKKKAQTSADANLAGNANALNTDAVDNMDPNSEMYTPTYAKDGAKYKKDQDALTLMFNQRKAEIMARTRAPGTTQTRFN